MRIGVVILCRYTSCRLPGKVLVNIRGKTVLDYIFERVRTADPTVPIVVATSADASDDAIAAHCAEANIPVFRGSLENVAERFLSCAKAHGFDFAVRINGDNVLLDPATLRRMIDIAASDAYDFISNVKGRSYPHGMSVEIVRTSFYEQISSDLVTPEWREHVTSYLYEHPVGRQEHIVNHSWPGAAGLSLALDSPSDLELISHVLEELGGGHAQKGLREVVAIADRYLERSPWRGRFGPLLIAEIGGNHEGDFEYAQKLADLAISTGVDFVKFQIYCGDSLVSRRESPDRNAHFKRFELTPDQHVTLARKCRLAGVGYLASVWDPAFLPWIDPWMAIYKIGSGDLTAYPMLERIATIGKPIILATGLATLDEVVAAVRILQSVNPIYTLPENLALLQCTSMYPIAASDANLAAMETLRKATGVAVGYSDHTEGGYALRVAAAMGAEVLEFHFTDRREGQSFRDHKVSLMPDEVKDLQQDLTLLRALRGDGVKRPLPIEIESGHVASFRRGIYAAREIHSGDTLTTDDLVCLRPNHGIDARDYHQLVGKRSRKQLLPHEKLEWGSTL